EFAQSLVKKNLDAEGLKLDLANESSINELIQSIISRFGRIDILVNNAVSRDGFKDIEQVSRAEWESSQRINSTGMMLITQGVLKVMRSQQSGNIINIGSIQGVVGPNF